MTRPVILIESPYSGRGLEAIRHLSCCLLDSVLRGECPIASHAIGPLCLPEHEPGDCSEWPRDKYGRKLTGREIGRELHGAMMNLHEMIGSGDCVPIKVAIYTDLGETDGMGWVDDEFVTKRQLLRGSTAWKIWNAGEWPSLTRWTRTNEGETK